MKIRLLMLLFLFSSTMFANNALGTQVEIGAGMHITIPSDFISFKKKPYVYAGSRGDSVTIYIQRSSVFDLEKAAEESFNLKGYELEETEEEGICDLNIEYCRQHYISWDKNNNKKIVTQAHPTPYFTYIILMIYQHDKEIEILDDITYSQDTSAMNFSDRFSNLWHTSSGALILFIVLLMFFNSFFGKVGCSVVTSLIVSGLFATCYWGDWLLIALVTVIVFFWGVLSSFVTPTQLATTIGNNV